MAAAAWAVGCGLGVSGGAAPQLLGWCWENSVPQFPHQLMVETILILLSTQHIPGAKADTGSTGAPFGIMLIRSPAR